MTSDRNTPEFLYRTILDGNGGARDASPREIGEWSAESEGTLWIHIDINDEPSRQWLAESSGLDRPTVDSLLDFETRPRSFATPDGLMVVLRGLNTNPGQDPEDMVSIRVWLERNRVISLRRRKLMSVTDIREAISKGDGPESPGAFLAMLVGRLADRIGYFVDDIETRVATLEEKMLELSQTEFRQLIAALRRQIASVRRFLAPQREALDRLYRVQTSLLTPIEAQELRDEADRITRYIEDIDLARERTVVLREEFLGQMAQEQNSRMYVLSIVTAVFLPMTFVTGLLGMNVGGLPGLDNPRGFLGAVGIMVSATVLLVTVFKLKKWL